MKNIKFIFVLALFLISACSLLFPSTPAFQEALDVLDSDFVTKVEVKSWFGDSNYYYKFEPDSDNLTTAFIIYPGGQVDPEAYAPLARAIADEGYLCFIIKMPVNLAMLGKNRADEIINDTAYSAVKKRAIGGHSLGGVVAAIYTEDNIDLIEGLVFWASYPAGSTELRDADLNVISIYGSLDALSTPDEVLGTGEEDPHSLPGDTAWVKITGGNHTQFGYYGTTPDFLQKGDNAATLERDNQTAQIVNYTVGFLNKL